LEANLFRTADHYTVYEEMTAIPLVVGRALRLMAQHPNVLLLEEPIRNVRTGEVDVSVDIRLDLPSRWLAVGKSPNGVLAVEPVSFSFPLGFPLHAPHITLRKDFDRSLAHVIPGALHEAAVPCIYDGNLDELLQRAGIAALLNQLVFWLHNAAFQRLIDPRQGWEPVRRDSLSDIIVMNADVLRSRVNRNGGHQLFRFEYHRLSRASHEPGLRSGVLGTIGNRVVLNRSVLSNIFRKGFFGKPPIEFGSSVALFVWPGKRADGRPHIADHYYPETVIDQETLRRRAEEYGCDHSLRSGLNWLASTLSGVDGFAFPIAIVLCARRPFHLIGSESALELCPYVLEIDSVAALRRDSNTQVRPAGLRDAISVPLLQRMAGNQSAEKPVWVQIGAGSIGSKIALHLARSGDSPSKLIDSGYLSPHNIARHGLYPTQDLVRAAWLQGKANALAGVITELDQKCESYFEDVRDILQDEARTKERFPRKSWAVVNCTASLAVREALASSSKLTLRVIEASLFSSARIGVILVEGPHRDPNCGDLISAFYQLALQDESLRSLIFEQVDSVQRIEVGQGCGSPTMQIPDGRVSMFAASMAEAIRSHRANGLPRTGLVLVGRLSKDEMGISWAQFDFEPSHLVRDKSGMSPLVVRIAQPVHKRILTEISRWPNSETGGILLGRFSEAAQTFYVVDLLTAPDDSKRSPTEFVLGTHGVRKALRSYCESSNNTLYSLGTWHSHLRTSDPSVRDYETACAIEVSRLIPSVVLIRTPDDYRLALASL